jgi:hypothetical protein
LLHAALAQAGCVVPRLAWLDGGHVDEKRAVAHGLGRALAEQHVLDHRSALQHADHGLRVLHGVGGARVDRGAEGRQALGLLAAAVPGVHGMTCFAQASGHGKAHEADAEDGDLHGMSPSF